jgi:four helix bundle protein
MNPREFKRFLLIARGSNSELQTQLELSGALGFANTQLLNAAQGISHEVEKMLLALLGNLKNEGG